MKRILTIALIAAFVLPAAAMAYTITVTNPTSSTSWLGINNSETITWTLSPDTDEIDNFFIYWQENKYEPGYGWHDEIIPIGPICWKDEDVRCANWNVTSTIFHVPLFDYYNATVTVEAWLTGRVVASGTSAGFIIHD